MIEFEKIAKAITDYEVIRQLITENKMRSCSTQESQLLNVLSNTIEDHLNVKFGRISELSHLTKALGDHGLYRYFKTLISSTLLFYVVISLTLLILLICCLLGCWFYFDFLTSRPTTVVIHRTREVTKASVPNEEDEKLATPFFGFFSKKKYQKCCTSFFTLITSPFFFALSSAFVSLVLFFMSLTTIFYIAKFNINQQRLQCATWDMFEGYFFGSTNYNLTLKGIPPNWKGSYNQLREIELLATQLNFNVTRKIPTEILINTTNQETNTSDITTHRPALESPEVSLCPECSKLVDALLNDTGLAPTLRKESQRLVSALCRYFLIYSVGDNLLKVKNFIQNMKPIPFKFVEQDVLTMAPVTLEILETLKKRLSLLSSNAASGILAKILETFHPSNYIFKEAKQGLVLGLENILHVDQQVKKAFDSWIRLSSSLAFFMRSLITVLFLIVVLSCLLGIASVGAALLHNKFSPRVRKFMLGLVILFTIMSLVSFLTFALIKTSSGLLYKGCQVSSVLFLREGLWNYLPPQLFPNSSNTITAHKLLLDTCMKTEGDGDISTALGIRRSVDRVRQWTDFELQHFEKDMETQFNFFFTPNILSSFLYYIENTNYFTMLPPLFLSDSFNLKDIRVFAHLYPDRINYISFADSVPEDISVVPLANIAGKTITSLKDILSNIVNVIVIKPVGIEHVLDHANTLARKYLNNSTICTSYFERHKKCFLDNSRIDISLYRNRPNDLDDNDDSNDVNDEPSPICNETEVYKSIPNCVLELTFSKNQTDDIWKFENNEAVEKEEKINLLRYLIILASHSHFIRRPIPIWLTLKAAILEDPDFQGLLDELNVTSKADQVTWENLFSTFFPNTSCSIKDSASIPLTDNHCRYEDFLMGLNSEAKNLTNILQQGVKTIGNSLKEFQQTIRGTMLSLVSTAEKILDDNNCHFIGTSLNIINSTICSLTFHSFSTLAVLLLLLTILHSLGAILTLCIYKRSVK